MKVICKKYYPFGEEFGSKYQSFLPGKSYLCDRIMHPTINEFWYIIKNEDYSNEFFSPSDFEYYFITIAEIRRKKLQKIKDMNEINQNRL